ncbi:MAG TPA: hypothetical protein VFM93_07700 [Candidatus Limnocylindria bacterium]|nr:hypothetical protein [Candidatus Limnocylindria bacterium]
MRERIIGAIVRLFATSTTTLVLLAAQPAYVDAAATANGQDGEQPAQLPGSGDRPVIDARGGTRGGTRGNTRGGGGTAGTAATAETPATPETVTDQANTPTNTEETATPTVNTPTEATVDTITEDDEEPAAVPLQEAIAGVQQAPAAATNAAAPIAAVAAMGGALHWLLRRGR